MEADPSGFLELYRDYLAEARLSLGEVKQAIQRTDARAVQARAHYLKSSSMVLGAVHVAREAGMLEEIARSGNLDPAAVRLKQVELCLQQVTARLVEELGGQVDPAGRTAA
jgi:HPt (histidine-containing phosphotransfer) domain-containing protein